MYMGMVDVLEGRKMLAFGSNKRSAEACRAANAAADELLSEIEETGFRLRMARQHFNSVSDPDMVDSCIYEINSLQSRYSYLLTRAKAEDISCDLTYKILR